MNENEVLKKIKKCIVWIRESTAGQMDGASPQTQREACQKFAGENGIKIIKEFMPPDGESGFDPRRRIEYNKMFDFVMQEKIELIIIYTNSRLHRNIVDAAQIWQWAIYQNDHYVYNVSEQELLHSKAPVRVKKNYLRQTAESQIFSLGQADAATSGLATTFKNGEPIGRSPVGYINKTVDGKGTFALDEIRAPLILKMFELYASGLSLRTLVIKMFELGLTSRGKKNHPSGQISHRGICYALNNPQYIGMNRMKGDDTVKGNWPPIVGKELFDEVQKKLAENRHGSGDRQSLSFPWRKYTECGFCGSSIWATRCIKTMADGSEKAFSYYKCSKMNDEKCSQQSYKEEEMDKLILSGIENIHIEFEVFAKLVKQVEKSAVQNEEKNKKELAKLERELASWKGREEKIMELEISGRYSPELAKTKIDEAKMKAAEIEAKIIEVKGKKNEKHHEQSIEAVEQFIKFKDRFLRLNEADRAKMLEGVLEKAIIKNGKVEFKFFEPWETIFKYSESLRREAEESWENPSGGDNPLGEKPSAKKNVAIWI